MTLHEFNILSRDELKDALIRCCGSSAWVQKMLPHIPAEDMVELLEDAEIEWWNCSQMDWKEAFAAHPEIGDAASLEHKYGAGKSWEADEQKQVQSASE